MLKTAEKLAVTSTDEKLRTYLVVKQGVGNMSKMLVEMKQEYGITSSSEIQCAEATNLAKNYHRTVDRCMKEMRRKIQVGEKRCKKIFPSESIRIVQVTKFTET